ncbi:hypothetical protein BD289DRAFT_455186 [Coniella lustricola]|uniref:Uncharacterized protein n=1 Tax=Coniella lustricola TaxID=2025994 RepID=A0A2T3A0N0_9PEZI|nr:hypothetical protein BD289DRAFT_455186 [Coniella lustricola]
MAPLARSFTTTTRSDSSTSGPLSQPPLSLAAVVGIGVAIAFIASLAAAAALYWFHFRPRAATRSSRPLSDVGNAMKYDAASTAPSQPRNRFGRVLAVLSPKRRKSKANLSATINFTLSDVNLEPLQLPDKKLVELPVQRRRSAAELDGGLFGDGKVLFGAEDGSDVDLLKRSSGDSDVLGPLPFYTSSSKSSAPKASRRLRASKSEQSVNLTSRYQAEETSARPDRESIIDKLAHDMPPVTTGPQAAWHRKPAPIPQPRAKERLLIPPISSLDFQPPRQRRPSADSLGSNFTVEEEARIQAQIVKNLSMIGKERVVGGNDIVHIPQISNKRYSWEN